MNYPHPSSLTQHYRKYTDSYSILRLFRKMGGNQYTSETMYGYEIFVPKGMSYNKFACKMHNLHNKVVKSLSNGRFQITSLLECVILDRCGEAEPDDNDDRSTLLIGFQPSGDLLKTMQLATSLAAFIKETPELKDLQLSDKPYFHSGVNWLDRVYEEDRDDEKEKEKEVETVLPSEAIEIDGKTYTIIDNKFVIDGVTYTIIDNKFVIDGITYTFNDEEEEEDA